MAQKNLSTLFTSDEKESKSEMSSEASIASLLFTD